MHVNIQLGCDDSAIYVLACKFNDTDGTDTSLGTQSSDFENYGSKWHHSKSSVA